VQISDRHGNPSETLSLSNSPDQKQAAKMAAKDEKEANFRIAALERAVKDLQRLEKRFNDGDPVLDALVTTRHAVAQHVVEKEVCGAEFAMYKVFDKFLASDTWFQTDPFDEKRFYEALSQVVWFDAFNPDEMAAYMQVKKKLSSKDSRSHCACAVRRFATKARAVKDFIKYTQPTGGSLTPKGIRVNATE